MDYSDYFMNKLLITCDICGRHYTNPYLYEESQPPMLGHWDFGTCSIECWIEHENFVDEFKSTIWSEEELERAEIEAEELYQILHGN